jgi:predicted nuclease with TOPRIM domain
MSKTEKNVKAANKSLRTELSQAIKVLHGLLSGLDKIEAGMAESDKAIEAESRYKEQLSKQERKIHDLETSLETVKDGRDKEVTLFATANLKLSEEFKARIRKQSVEYESMLDQSQRRMVDSEQKWKEAFKSETGQIDRIKANEKASQREYEMKLKQIQQVSQTEKDALQKKLQDTEQRVAALLERNQALSEELAQLNTIQRGRETEVNVLTKRLTNLEAFSPKSQEE